MEISLGNQPFDIDFHPSDQLVSSALITGDLLLYRYSADATPQKLLTVQAHTESCRAVRFINGGRAMITGSPDRSILATDVETGSAIARLEDAHEEAINKIINLDDSNIASGDDSGVIKVWDTRQRSCCHSFSAHEDYVSDLAYEPDSKKLLGTSGDGTLSVCNLRRNKIQAQSEFSEDELLSVVIVKKGKKIVCGTQTGTLLLYSWGYYKDCSDRFVDLCPNNVGSMLKLDEDKIITGSENGMINLISILPSSIIQPIAEHSEYPIEGLAFSHDRRFLGSIGHDSMLKIWDLDDILQQGQAVAPDNEDNDMDVDMNQQSSKAGSKRKHSSDDHKISSSNDFFADL